MKAKPFERVVVVPGERFGKLEVIYEAEKMVQPSGQSARSFMCMCECGKTKRVRLSHLRKGRVTSCGCIAAPVHGMVGTPLHNSWRAMKMRCEQDGYNQSELYKGRGIDVCKEWSSNFLEFAKWSIANGFRPGLHIDRIDNNKGYHPWNCRWVTPTENARNKRTTVMVTYRGQRMSLQHAIDMSGTRSGESAIYARLVRGWSADEAIDTPIRQGNYR